MHQHNHAKSTVLCWYKYRITLSTEQKHLIFTYSSSCNFFYFCLLQSLGTLSFSVGCETILSIALLLSAESCERNKLIQSFSYLLLDSHILRGRCRLSTFFEVNNFYVAFCTLKERVIPISTCILTWSSHWDYSTLLLGFDLKLC